MAWDDEMVIILRGLLQDYPDPTTGDPPKYSDDTLSQMILITSINVQLYVGFNTKYNVNVPNGTISPDPTSSNNRDENFINLVSLKSACNFINAEIREMVQQGISVRDGTSAVSLGRSSQSLEILRKTYCSTYEDAVYAYKIGHFDGVYGEAIVGPFKFLIGGNVTNPTNPYAGPPGRVWRGCADREDWYGMPADIYGTGWY